MEEQQNKLPERRSDRAKRSHIRYGYGEYADNAINSSESCHHVAYNVIEIDEPTSIQDALQSSYAEEWKGVLTWNITKLKIRLGYLFSCPLVERLLDPSGFIK